MVAARAAVLAPCSCWNRAFNLRRRRARGELAPASTLIRRARGLLSSPGGLKAPNPREAERFRSEDWCREASDIRVCRAAASSIVLYRPRSEIAARACPLLSPLKRRGASWVVLCLGGCVSWHMVGERQTQTTIPRKPWGPIKVSDYPGGGGGRGSSWLLVQILTGLFVLQDLKEKKLLEEKENGKDAATNGKVWPPSVCSTAGRPRSLMSSQDNDENGEPEIGEEEEVDEEEDEDEEDDGDGKRKVAPVAARSGLTTPVCRRGGRRGRRR